MGDEREDSAESHAIGVSWSMRILSEVRKRSRLRKDSAPYSYPPQGSSVKRFLHQRAEGSRPPARSEL